MPNKIKLTRPRAVLFHVHLPPEIAQRIRDTAHNNEITHAELLRRLIGEALEETVRVRPYKRRPKNTCTEPRDT